MFSSNNSNGGPATPSGSSNSSTGGTPSAFSAGTSLPPVDQLSSLNSFSSAGNANVPNAHNPNPMNGPNALATTYGNHSVSAVNGKGTSPNAPQPGQTAQTQRPRVLLPPLGAPSNTNSGGPFSFGGAYNTGNASYANTNHQGFPGHNGNLEVVPKTEEKDYESNYPPGSLRDVRTSLSYASFESHSFPSYELF